MGHVLYGCVTTTEAVCLGKRGMTFAIVAVPLFRDDNA